MKKVLIIDDDASIRGALRDILNWQGYEYREATNGYQGVEIAKEYLPDLIICDVTMPQLDGYGVLQKLQEYDASTATIPFIFLTAKASREERRYGMSLGADDYISKPFTAKDVVDAVSRRLAKFEKLQERNEKKLDEVRAYINMTLPHELRTPLTGIIGYISLLENGYTEMAQEEMGDMLSRLHDSALRLQHTVENYLLFSQLTLALKDVKISSKLRQNAFCINTSDLLLVASHSAAKQYERLDDLQLNITDAPLAILGDLLKKMIQELVGNAFKFSERGQSVEVVGEELNGRYQITITDHGRGIRQDHIQQLQANRQFDRDYFEQQGTGLGLTIAKQVIQLFDGEFVIDSQLNMGTKIRITLDLISADQIDLEDDE